MAGIVLDVDVDADAEARRPAFARPRLAFGLTTLVLLLLGWLEGWYGFTAAGDVYGSDAVQYLDMARAFERRDLHAALNPLWSDGYSWLLAQLRPLFAAGNAGEWKAIRTLDFAIFALSWIAFAFLVRELLHGRERTLTLWFAATCVFVTTQVSMDQVSRVGPDQLVAAIFFLVAAVLLRLAEMPRVMQAVLLGALCGVGFLVKSIFLPLGCAALLIAAFGLLPWRHKLRTMVPATLVFAIIVGSYGVALSRATGEHTLEEAGALNYAWHVNRLAKWVHWEGGVDPADKAWPKPWIARLAEWQQHPPDFGKPVHPSVLVGTSPRLYSFHAPVEATYAPYFDPPYFYQGYRHVLNWRYQLIALGKNGSDLLLVLVKQPLFWGIGVALLVLYYRQRHERRQTWVRGPDWFGEGWPAAALALAGVAIYLPVHLEGRYIAPFLAVIVVARLAALHPVLDRSGVQRGLVAMLIGVSFAVGLVASQHGVWSRALHRWKYQDNLEWREAEALHAVGLSPRTEIGVISWTPNVQCDWAYLAQLRITSEIASSADEKAFWMLPRMEQAIVLLNFRQAGAEAIVTRDQPATDAPGWEKLEGVPIWIYRF